MTWVPIPSGAFNMGCSPGDTLCASSEFPVHLVSVNSYYMLETEVTEGQYEAVIGVNPVNNPLGPNYPVDKVTLAQAEGFCQGVGGSLPSEAEWEYAARGGGTSKYYCGSGGDCLLEHEWFAPNSGWMFHEVKTKDPNPYGLFDMLGNLPEWVKDCWHPTYEGAGSGQWAWTTNCFSLYGGEYLLIRGGSYGSEADQMRVSQRWGYAPNYPKLGKGFRCVRY